MKKEINIGVYNEDGALVGYKADTFWSLTKNRKYAKTHYLVDGKIEERLIQNLRRVLAPKESATSFVNSIIDALSAVNKEQLYNDFETFLLGYIDNDNDDVTYTHRIFNDDVQELEEDI